MIAFFSTDWRFDPLPGQKVMCSWGGTMHYRMILPGRELEKHGWNVVFTPSMKAAPDGHLRVLGAWDSQWHDPDVIVIQRWMGANGVDLARRAQAAGQVIVNDIDDNFWALPKSNMAHRATDPRRSEHNRDNYRKMLAVSDEVWCSTPAIAEELHDCNVRVVKNAIDLGRWRVHDPVGMVGWVGGIPWRGRDLPLLNGVLGPFLEKHGLPFYHGGAVDDPAYPQAWKQLGLTPGRVRLACAPLTSIDRYPALWDPIGLAVIPLEDSRFNRSKSWLKGLEASACGLPFVASRLPEYEALGCGRLASSRREWREHLEALLDPEVRRAEGQANRRRAEELSISRMWVQWDEALRGLGARELCTAAS